MQMGVTIGTIMVANVLMIIIPGQRRVVAALKVGEAPTPAMVRVASSALYTIITLPYR